MTRINLYAIFATSVIALCSIESADAQYSDEAELEITYEVEQGTLSAGEGDGGAGWVEECSSGSKQCVDGDAYQDCNDGRWSQAYSCSASWPGTSCSDGWCVGSSGGDGGGGEVYCGGTNTDWDPHNCGTCGNNCEDQGLYNCNYGNCE